uniref:C-type lectin domain-containing protein n=1 Tax=Chrysemys picta bellii TaxID=8478 RepID=A0A8C3F7E2_CHRPI
MSPKLWVSPADKFYSAIKSLMSTVSQGLAEAQLDRDTIRRDAQRNLSLQQDYIEFTSIKCPPGWQQFQKSCYFFSTSAKSWQDAKQFCTDHGSGLVIVNTEEEQMFLSNQITNPDVYWLGLSDSAKEGEWRWVDGSLLSLSFWRPGEPNNAAEECGTLHSDGNWNNATCSSTEHWICERQWEVSHSLPHVGLLWSYHPSKSMILGLPLVSCKRLFNVSSLLHSMAHNMVSPFTWLSVHN